MGIKRQLPNDEYQANINSSSPSATNPYTTVSDLATISNSLIISNTPPLDITKTWFNTTDSILYYNDGADWVSVQLYETTFIDQGNTPNNTFFRVGNCATSDLGVGFPLEINVKIIGLSYARNPGSAALGNFWLYSNSVTGTNFASVVSTFTVNASARGFIPVPVPTNLNANSYITIRWNGSQTNNNIVSLKYRKRYV